LSPALPGRGGLMIPSNAENTDRSTEQIGRCYSKHVCAIAYIRQETMRYAKHAAKIMVPLRLADIEQQRARRVGGVGQMHLAACETPQQKAVDRTEGELAALGRRASTVHVVKQPGDLACGKIGIEQKSRFGGNVRFMTGAPQRIAIIRGAPILPDDRVVDRLAALAVPDHRGFPLIWNSQSTHVPPPSS